MGNSAAALRERRHIIEGERYEAYQEWAAEQLSEPRFASVRMLVDDLRNHRGQILPETWERFGAEERTWAAETLDTPHSLIERFRFDGRDIIIKEGDGVAPRQTFRDMYQNGLDASRRSAESEPGLAFQVRRDQLFMNFYEQVERMMRGDTVHDTIHMVSACPLPEEISDDPLEAARLLGLKNYNLDRRLSLDYTARRLPNGELELSVTTLDSSNLAAHVAVLQEYGYPDESFALQTSHEYGAYLSFDRTIDSPIEVVIAARVGVYDEAMQELTGQKHRYGRLDEGIDAHEFFEEHCEDYWAGFTAYHELLARHVAGGELAPQLRDYLLSCMQQQEQVGKSVLSQEDIDRLRVQLMGGRVTPEMVMSCRELLVYDHHATLKHLLGQYNETGEVPQLRHEEGRDLMGAYADAASANGSAAAAAGETFAGCETATSVTSLAVAAQIANETGMSLEQSLRALDEEAAHCLRIQLFGFTIRRGVHCPFCEQRVDARDTQLTIECLSDDCGAVLHKSSGEVTRRAPTTPSQQNGERPLHASLRNGQVYDVGGRQYRREQQTVVGGAVLTYVDDRGERITGPSAEQLEAVIAVRQLAAETPAS